MSLEQIINGCKAKDRKFQKALYLLTAEDLTRVALRYMKNKEEARDIVQDAYLVIFKKINQYDPTKGSIGGWTARIVTNLALEKLRRRKVVSDLDSLPIALHPVDTENVLNDLSAEELLVTIMQLPDSYRIIFLLHTVEGYKHEEIADKLGISASTSRSQLVRARAKLRSILGKKNITKLNHNVRAK